MYQDILSEINHLLSEDDVMLHQLLGEAHRMLDVDIVILGAVYHHQSPVPHTVTSSSHAGPMALLVTFPRAYNIRGELEGETN